MTRCAHVSRVTFLLFFILLIPPPPSPPKDRTNAIIIKNANKKTQRRVPSRARNRKNREGETRRVSLRTEKKSFGEMTAYNFVRENKEKEKSEKKKRDAAKREK